MSLSEWKRTFPYCVDAENTGKVWSEKGKYGAKRNDKLIKTRSISLNVDFFFIYCEIENANREKFKNKI